VPAAPSVPAEPAEAAEPARPPAGLWFGVALLGLGVAAVLAVLSFQVTSIVQAVFLATPVALLGFGLERVGRAVGAKQVRAIGLVTLVAAVAGPAGMAASPPVPLDRTTVRASVPPGATTALLRASMGSGQLRVGPGGPGLFQAELRSSGASQSGVSTSGRSMAVVDLRAPAQRGLLDRNRGSDWVAALTPALPWRLEVDAGAVTADLDLQRLNLDSAWIHAGPSRLAVRFGPPATRTRIDIRLDTGVLDLYLPRNAGLELQLSGAVVRDLGGWTLRERGRALVTGGDPAMSYVISAHVGAGRVRLHWR
jgi:hypothetical protein